MTRHRADKIVQRSEEAGRLTRFLPLSKLYTIFDSDIGARFCGLRRPLVPTCCRLQTHSVGVAAPAALGQFMRIRGWRNGFTLIELLATLAVIGILAGLLLPALGAAKGRARSVHCLSNLRQMGIAVRMYADENEARLPVALAFRADQTNTPIGMRAIQDVLTAHLSGVSNVFKCPEDRKGMFVRSGSSYEWNVGVNGRLLHRIGHGQGDQHASQVFLLRDREGWHSRGRRNAVFADNHACPESR